MSSVALREAAAESRSHPQLFEAPPVADGLPAPRRHLAIVALLAATVLVVLDGAIANVSWPSLSRALQFAAADCVWVVTSYQLCVVVALLPAAALGESFGGRRIFLLGAALFTAASA